MADLKNVFQRIAEGKGKSTERGRFLNPSISRLMIKKIMVIKGFKGESFVVEAVVQSARSTGETDRKGTPYIPLPVGALASLVVKLDNPKAQGANFDGIYRFLCGLMNLDIHTVTTSEFMDLLQDLCGEEGNASQPMAGKLVDVEVFNKPMKSDPTRDFTHHRWSFVPQTDDEIAAGRKSLGL